MILLSLFSFGSQKSNDRFRHNGVSFKVPPKWKITKQTPYDETGYYVALQKKGLSFTSALLIWTTGQSDLDEYVQWGHATLTQVITKPIPQAVTPIYDDKINGMATRSFKSEYSKMGNLVQVVTHSFHGSNKTLVLLELDFAADFKENEFRVIKDSFTVL